MLVLARRVGEKIRIGADVTLTIVEIDRNKVRIAFEAPRDVPIHRTELLEAPPAPKQQAAAAPDAGTIATVWGKL